MRLRDGKFLFAREQNRFDAMTTWDFLRLLHARSLKSRRRVVAITDNAKYHHANLHRAWRQEHEPQFHLIALISIRSKGYGSSPESSASTTNISRALEQ